jgi:hypothetical protein
MKKLTFSLLLCSLLAILFFMLKEVRKDNIELSCQGRLCEINYRIKDFYQRFGRIPRNQHPEENKKKTSWRNELVNYDTDLRKTFFLCDRRSETELNSEVISDFFYLQGPYTVHEFLSTRTVDLEQEMPNGRSLYQHSCFNKIFIVEDPWSTTLVSDPHDLEIDEVIELWHKREDSPNRHRSISYITFAGNYGSLDDFSTEEELRAQLVFSEEEWAELMRLDMAVVTNEESH